MQPVALVAIFSVVAFIVSSCGLTRPVLTSEGFEPLAKTERRTGSTIRVYFATNRNPKPQSIPKTFGNRRRIGNPYFGSAELISRNGSWHVNAITVEKENLSVVQNIRRQLARNFSGRRPHIQQKFGSRAFAFVGVGKNQCPPTSFVQNILEQNKDVLLFLHGAAFDFNGALSTAARLSEIYKQPGRELTTLIFTYPTNGRAEPINYFNDRNDARLSGEAMSLAFSRYLRCVGAAKRINTQSKTVFVAHSLGVYATRVALQSIFPHVAPPQKVFDIAFLMGGDDDQDALTIRKGGRSLLNIAKSVAVYFANDDALLYASILGNQRIPIGLFGPERADSTDYGAVPVQAIDAAEFARVGDPVARHRYYIASPRVIQDVRLAIKFSPHLKRIPGRQKVGRRTVRLLPLSKN